MNTLKNSLLKILDKYLLIYPDELSRQNKLLGFINFYDDSELINWNNFAGHITVGGFIYSRKENLFLVLYHKDLNMFLYPGGHVDITDCSLIEAVRREIFEETGIKNINKLNIGDDELIPFDIDTHLIEYNERLNLPQHYHFDFRYLFFVDDVIDIKIDNDELIDYKWVSIDDLSNDVNYKTVISKLKFLIK